MHVKLLHLKIILQSEFVNQTEKSHSFPTANNSINN